MQILSTLCTLGVGLLLVIERSRLALAGGLIREAGRGLCACGLSLLLLPPIVWLLFAGFIVLWIFVLGYIATTGTENFCNEPKISSALKRIWYDLLAIRHGDNRSLIFFFTKGSLIARNLSVLMN